jgi:hypothetical protein
MAKSKMNWEPDTQQAFDKVRKGNKKMDLGIDARSEERINDLGENLKKKNGFWKFAIILIVILLIFDAFILNGELIINFLKNLK